MDAHQGETAEPSSPRSEQAKLHRESEEERLDRNLDELMQEIRVVIPGIQFLFAFLLVVPFQTGWTHVSGFERGVYFVALALTAIASVCLMAPAARHRIRFRELDKEWVVHSANRLLISGLVVLAGAIGSVLLLVADVVYGGGVASAVVVVAAILIGWLWFGQPILRSLRARGRG